MTPWSVLGPPRSQKSYLFFLHPFWRPFWTQKGTPKSTKIRFFSEKWCCKGCLVMCVWPFMFFQAMFIVFCFIFGRAEPPKSSYLLSKTTIFKKTLFSKKNTQEYPKWQQNVPKNDPKCSTNRQKYAKISDFGRSKKRLKKRTKKSSKIGPPGD